MNCSRSLHAIVAATACALLTAPAALAATTTTPSGENTPLHLDPAPAAGHAGGSGGGIVRTVVGLAVVIGVIFGLHWILKQVKSSRESASTGGGLQSLATLALGPGRSLHLVRAGSEVVLVGAADNAVTPLRVYTEVEAHELGLLSLDDDGDGDGDGGNDDRGGRRGGRGPRARGPLNAGAGLPPDLRDLFRRIQRLTVRG
jgi:flagellar protein FliO/FliZ